MTEPSETRGAKGRKPKKPRARKAKKSSKGNGAPKTAGAAAGAAPPDSIDANGQTLVKVPREKNEQKSIDDVAKKHVSDASTGDPSDDLHPEFNASTGATSDAVKAMAQTSTAGSGDEDEGADGYPTIAEVAVGHGAVPPMEIDPMKREGATMGPVGWTQDTPDLRDPDDKPRCLEDLMSIFPVGTDSQYYVQVYRKSPKNWAGNNCAGMMRPIRESMTTEDFKWAYGGGEYVLTVYGPPKRGGQLDPRTGRARPKALTGKVQFTIPYGSAFGVPPNPDAAFEEEDEPEDAVMEDDMMSRHRGGFARPVTAADASIHKANLDLDQQRWSEERREKREMAERLREAEEEKFRMQQAQAGVVSNQTVKFMEMLEDSRRDRDDRQREREREEVERRKEAEQRYQNAMEEQRKQEREEFKRMQEKPSGAAELASAIGPLIEKVTPKGDDGELRALRSELKMVRDSHDAEIKRLYEQQKVEMERERTMRDEVKKLADERVKEAQDTMNRRLTETREEAARRIREVEERAERDVTRAKEDGRTRAEDIKQFWEGRLKDEERNHKRELEATKGQMETRLATDKSVYEGREKMLMGETERARADVSRLEAEVREKGDVVKQVGQVTKIAEALGMEKAGGAEAPGDWKQILATAGLSVLQNLPETIREAGQAVAGAKGRGAPVPMQGPPALAGQPAPQQLPGMGFGTEDEDYVGEETWSPEPEYPGGEAAAAVGEPESLSQQIPEAPVAAAPPAAVTQPAEPYGAPPGPSPQAQPNPPQRRRALKAKPAPQPEPEVEEMEIPDEVILAYRKGFEDAYNQKMPPQAFAEELAKQYGKPTVKQIASILTPERVMKALMSTPEGQRSPLVRGQGRTYLRQVLEAIRRAGA